MWKLYTIECEKTTVNLVMQHIYRKVFCENYNLELQLILQTQERPMFIIYTVT
jgi:hypothetical protein